MIEWWNRVLEIEGARWIIYPSILLALLLMAFYFLQTLRNLAIGGSRADNDHLGTFRKMREEGSIDPDEYRKLAELVPLPETESRDKPDAKQVAETGPDALTEAAREVIKKSAAKNQNSDSKNYEAPESGESLES